MVATCVDVETWTEVETCVDVDTCVEVTGDGVVSGAEIAVDGLEVLVSSVDCVVCISVCAGNVEGDGVVEVKLLSEADVTFVVASVAAVFPSTVVELV